MNTTRTTERRALTVPGYQFPLLEPLPDYGWRCGMYSLRPASQRWASHPEFLSGLRRGRAQRQSVALPGAVQTILGRADLIERRRQIQRAYSDAAYSAKLVSAGLRAAARNDGRISSTGRNIGAVQRERAMSAADGIWDQHSRLSDAYAREVNRLCALRGMPQHITGTGL